MMDKGSIRSLDHAIDELKSGKQTNIMEACEFISTLGPDASAAVPHLIPRLLAIDFSLPNDDILKSLVNTFGAIGPKAIDGMVPLCRLYPLVNQPLKEAIKSALQKIMLYDGDILTISRQLLYLADENKRSQMLYGLSCISEGSVDLISLFVEALKDHSPIIRCTAIDAIRRHIPFAESTINAIIDLLKDDDWYCRYLSLLALADFGAKAKQASPEIIKLLKNEPRREVRLAALTALGMAGANAVTIGSIIEVLKGEFGDQLLVEALRIFREFGRQAESAAPYLGEILQFKAASSEWWAAKEIIITIGKIGNVSSSIFNLLHELFNVSALYPSANYCLYLINDQPNVRLTAIGEMLSSPQMILRHQASWYISGLDQRAEPIIPTLRNALSNQNEEFRFRILTGLINIGNPLPKEVDEFLFMILEGNASVEALIALGKLGPRARPALKLLKVKAEEYKAGELLFESRVFLTRLHEAIKNIEVS